MKGCGNPRATGTARFAKTVYFCEVGGCERVACRVVAGRWRERRIGGDRAESRLDDPAADGAFDVADGVTVGRMTLLTDPISKVGRQRFARFAGVREVDEISTDDELEEDIAEAEVVCT